MNVIPAFYMIPAQMFQLARTVFSRGRLQETLRRITIVGTEGSGGPAFLARLLIRPLLQASLPHTTFVFAFPLYSVHHLWVAMSKGVKMRQMCTRY